ncbi:holo-ACP synthase [Candidatus Pandoraea novymonadis]|uniref:Holo-[acyl-carrier-protein] synthase n=1 Tax=Candidatus Pandoraea novymonadis TaxID=1808959 RepID=A0ABX5FCW0_9BURK|nr:holo-ACP synthase [Candidatus Pandoraea novymonadis]PSB91638.1 Holo-[acyl-carrier-protein] synthase [Candidatus Pandoraea novymonadis]
MIYGIGTDILDIRRIVRVMELTKGRFATRVLGPDELKIYHERNACSVMRGLAYISTRFAAKEAVSKAIGLGMHMPMTWRSMQTLNEPSGRPLAIVSGVLADWLAARDLVVDITITDEKNYAVAFAIASITSPERIGRK